MLKISVQTIREKGEEFFREIYQERYLVWSGQKDESNFSAIYEKYSVLSSKETIESVIEFMNKAGEEEKKSIRYILEFLINNYEQMQVKELNDNADNIESDATVIFPDGRKVSYYAAQIEMMSNKNSYLKTWWTEEKIKIMDKINPSLEDIHKRTMKIPEELGFSNYISMFQTISGIDLYKLSESMQDFLKKTQDIYDKAIKIEYGKPETFSSLFPEDAMVNIIKKLLEDMDIGYSGENNIKFDTDTREKKAGNGFCAPIEIPSKIFLVIAPLGISYRTYGAFLHELGHALSNIHMDEHTPFEYMRLGDNSVEEGFAATFDHLIYNPHWLFSALGIKKPEKFLRLMFFRDLSLLRQWAAEFIYEIELRKTEELKGKGELYKNILSNACKGEFPEAMYLRSIDPAFEIINYIKSALFEPVFSAYLEKNYGEKWFNDPAAGNFLKNLWKIGKKHTLFEILQSMGIKDFFFEPFIARLNKYLV
ncbi:MAG: hypothetical protein PHX21_01510 [bacterium]|nr:hypothetical protein [bacterium]